MPIRRDQLTGEPLIFGTVDRLNSPPRATGCKRPCFHDEYLDTYNRPNVKLIDTEGRGVERITERAVVVAGKPYEIDCLIFATDFEVGTGYTRQSGYDVIGRNGRRLSEEWANGLITFHGLHSEGFPNCYFMGMTQTGSTPNFPHMLNEQSKHIAYIVRHATTEGLCVIEARPRLKMSGGTPFIDSHIVGHVSLRSVLPVTTTTKGGPVRTLEASSLGCMAMGQRPFFQLLRQWREEGNLNGLQCRK